MSLEYGIPILLTLGALWLLYRMEIKRPPTLPPPSYDERNSIQNFKRMHQP
jgi:hypothetical protein